MCTESKGGLGRFSEIPVGLRHFIAGVIEKRVGNGCETDF